jgi:hypothetical protein
LAPPSKWKKAHAPIQIHPHSNRDKIVIPIADVLRITHALRVTDVVLREATGLDSDEPPVVHWPAELHALLEQIEDCYDLLCDRLEDRGMFPPARQYAHAPVITG